MKTTHSRSPRGLMFICATFLLFGFTALLHQSLATQAQQTAPINDATFKALQFRAIGPAIMGGRIDDFAVVESNPSVYYVGAATGGVWKTVNNGTTFEPI